MAVVAVTLVERYVLRVIGQRSAVVVVVLATAARVAMVVSEVVVAGLVRPDH